MKEKRRKEDYLRIIHELYEEKGVRSIALASSLKISKASVSEMLRKLAKENLVRIEPYSKVFLTAKGRNEAKNLSDKHFVIKKFVEKFFKYNEEKAAEEAHKLEHALSEESVNIISKILELDIKTFNTLSYVG